jgi:hypothetical protein
MQKCSKLSTRLNKTVSLGLYISSEPTNSAHCLGVQEHHTAWINASHRLHHWFRSVGVALSPSVEEAGSKCLPRQCQVGSPCLGGDGGLQRGLTFSFVLKTFPGPDEWSSLTHPGSPQSHLSAPTFRNRSGQSWLIIDVCHVSCALFQHHIWQQEAL